jgi:hypothetical protein
MSKNKNTEKQHNINQSETVTIKRSQISFAPYNPRKEDPAVVNEIKKNFKRVGFLGGIVWNETTGNLVSGHKRIQALDIINKYDGTSQTDYDIKVEKVTIDEKTEKEQNIFMNSQSVQGKFDNMKLADLFPDINYEFAGLNENDINIMQLEVPEFMILNSHSIEGIEDDIKAIEKPYQEAKEAIIQAKQQQKEATAQKFEDQETYIIVNFDNLQNKLYFLENYGFNADDKFIRGELMLERLEQ